MSPDQHPWCPEGPTGPPGALGSTRSENRTIRGRGGGGSRWEKKKAGKKMQQTAKTKSGNKAGHGSTQEWGGGREEGRGGGEMMLTHTQTGSYCCFLTNILEASINWSIIKIHTADSQRIQTSIMMPHHLFTHTHTHIYTFTHRVSGR